VNTGRSPAVPVPRLLPTPPVEYAVAVDHFLAQASLGSASRRIYRISLTSWAWALVGKQPPHGTRRRGAAAPVVPLARLDDRGTPARLAAAAADRAAVTDVRTVNRELSALRSAVGWWRDQQWIQHDPTAGLRHLAGQPAMLPALTARQVASLFGAETSLREQAFWRVLYDTGARAEEILALDAGRLDLPGDRGRIGAPLGAGPAFEAASWIQWQRTTTDLLSWLLAGRAHGPVFLTDRRAPASAAARNVCPITGRARMSYRRAAEIFTSCTRPLDPAGRGWTLHQLLLAGVASRSGPA
jgi:integrase